jgi:hypothetical protein
MKSESKERPILFSGTMVRAILEGRKTQTRRVVKWPSVPDGHDWDYEPYAIMGEGKEAWPELHWNPGNGLDETRRLSCLYGEPGDRLWVRENFYQPGCWLAPDWPGADADDATWSGGKKIIYAADAPKPEKGFRSFPSIHMPRWASRILLEVVAVRVERLQEITEGDAEAEGAGIPLVGCDDDFCRGVFREIWQGINGPGSWDENPWVWVVEFKRVEVSK